MNDARSWLLSALEHLCGRGDADRGAELMADVRELFAERRARIGLLRACARALWDLTSLALRPRPHTPVAPHLVSVSGRGSMNRLLGEVGSAWRVVRRRPLVSGTVTLSLALGIGLSVLAVTIMDALLVRPLPFPNSQRLLSVFAEFRPESGYTFPRFSMSWPEFLDYARDSRAVDLAAWTPSTVAIADRSKGNEAPERIPGVRTTSSAFAMLETAPQLGRALDASHDETGGPCGVVLSDGLWRDRFGGARDVLGRVLDVSGTACEVVGVMPAGFNYPNDRARLWLPFHIDRNSDVRGNHGVAAIGKLRAGVTLEAAEAERATLMAQWATAFPHHKGHGLVLVSLRDDTVGSVRLPLLVLGSSVALVLLIIIANVSSLLVAHGEARRRELAVRGALGAGRLRLVRQLMLESLILAGAGGALGSTLAWVSLAPVIAAYPGPLPRASEIHVDARVVLAALALSLLTGLLVAMLPALRLTRDSLSGGLRAGDRSGASAPGRRWQTTLVVAELALSLAVSVGALLLMQSFLRMQRVPLGFDSTGVMTAVVSLPAGDTRTHAQTTAFFADFTTRLRAVRGVTAAGAMSSMPLAGSAPPDDFTIEGRPVPPPTKAGSNADFVMVTPGAFEALSVNLVRGRFIADADTPSAAPSAVINEALARQYWLDADPLGHRIRYAEGVKDGQWSAWGPWITIVGVASDMRTIAPAQPARPAIYVAHAQLPRSSFYTGRTMGLLVRTDGGAPDLAASIRTLARSLDGQSALSAVRSMDDVLGATMARPRFMGGLMAVFAAVALVVAALGVYGIAAYGVARRTREFGVRLALGAHRGHIAGLVGRQLAVMLGLGIPLGLAGAAGLAIWMDALLFGVRPFDLRTYAGVAMLLAVAVAVAALLPTRRAVRVDPLIAMRAD